MGESTLESTLKYSTRKAQYAAYLEDIRSQLIPKRLRVVKVPYERVIVNIALIPPEGRDPAEHVISGLSDGCVPPGISPVLNHIHSGMHPTVLAFGIQIHQEGVTLAILVDWLSISNRRLNHAQQI